MKTIAWRAAVAVLIVTVFFGFYAMRTGVAMLAIAILAASALEPTIAMLALRAPRWLAVVLTYVWVTAAAVFAIFLVLSVVPAEVGAALDSLVRGYNSLRGQSSAGGFLAKSIASRLPDLSRALDPEQLEWIGKGALGLTAEVLGTLARGGLVLVLAVLWSLSRQTFERLWLSLVAVRSRAWAREIWYDASVAAGRGLAGELVQSALALLVLMMVLPAFGLRYPTIAALLVALLRPAPLVGIPLAALATGVCAAEAGPARAVAAVLTAITVVAVLRATVGRRMTLGRRTHPLLSGFVMLALFSTLGLVGLLIATALSAAIQAAAERLMAGPEAAAAPSVTLEDVQRRLIDLEGLLARDGPARPELLSVADRLSQLTAGAAALARR